MSVDLEKLVEQEYKYGFVTDVEQEIAPTGLNEDTIKLISSKKNEPEWLLEWRLSAYAHWLTMEVPKWPNITYPPIDFQGISYYAGPKKIERPKSLDDIDPEIKEAYDKLGIPLEEQKMLAGVAVDAIFDSVSVITTFKETLAEAGVIFCSMSEAVEEHPELVKKYMGSVVPHNDNFYAALNMAVFTDGSFVYLPKGVRGQRRDLQVRNKARKVPGKELTYILDPGGDGLRDNVEIPELHIGRGRFGRGILLGRPYQ